MSRRAVRVDLSRVPDSTLEHLRGAIASDRLRMPITRQHFSIRASSISMKRWRERCPGIQHPHALPFWIRCSLKDVLANARHRNWCGQDRSGQTRPRATLPSCCGHSLNARRSKSSWLATTLREVAPCSNRSGSPCETGEWRRDSSFTSSRQPKCCLMKQPTPTERFEI